MTRNKILQNAKTKVMMEDQIWNQIRTAAIHDEVLKDLLEQIKFYYLIKYDSLGARDD